MSRFTQSTPVTELSGVGKTRAEQLKKLGIETFGDLVYYFPRAYENRGDTRLLSGCTPDTTVSLILTVATTVRSANIRRGLTISRFRAFDESGSVEITFFNSPYVKDVFTVGAEFRFYGKITLQKGKPVLTNPKYEPIIEGRPLADYVPIYSLTEGISSKQIDKLIFTAINDVLPSICDPLPDSLRIKYSLPTLTYALKNAHFPEDDKALEKSLSRLAFDEMLLFGIGISMSAMRKSKGEGIRLSPCSLEPLTSLLPYELTSAQKAAINDVYRDTVIGKDGIVSPMARIIVGDVGCGKTVCAEAAIYIAAKSGCQSAFMVPTEILARQHFKEISDLFSKLGISTALLLGSTGVAERRRIYRGIESGEIDVVVGTHALLSDKLNFCNLGLIITDEQHRFGVAQRAALKEKSKKAHLLVMSATPIPRTLALTMYGDLDISRITEMPKGRQRVDTFTVDEGYRARLDDFIRKQVMLGGQCYIVCPAIEAPESDGEVVAERIGELVDIGRLNLKNVTDYAKELSKRLPDIPVGVLHGKMKPAEKDELMSRFKSGEVKVLVSTTVIEVGVNVPNASLMIVENAERYGLSQLHQLRGRVGRGERKSYCVLVSDLNSPKAKARLDVMKTTYDGFEIAEKDLMLRGPGDLFSSNSDINLRQSGGFEFKFASMCNDYDLFEAAFSSAKAIVSSDPTLECSEHLPLRDEVERRFSLYDKNIS